MAVKHEIRTLSSFYGLKTRLENHEHLSVDCLMGRGDLDVGRFLHHHTSAESTRLSNFL